MRLPSSSSTVSAADAGAVFFAQAVAEMLFAYSPDSYHAPALSTVFRAAEAKVVTEMIQDGRVQSESAAAPVAEELAWSLVSDPVTENSMGVDANLLAADLRAKKDSVEAVHRLSAYAFSKLSDSYINTTHTLIREEISKTEPDFGKLYKLAQNFCANMTMYDYDKEYIYYTLLHSYFYNSKENCHIKKINKFLDRFDLSRCDWDIYIWVSEGFSEKILNNAKNFDSVDVSALPSFLNEKYKRFFCNRDNRVLLHRSAKEMDSKSCRRHIEYIMDYVAGMIRTVYPAIDACWDKDVLVVKTGETKGHILERSIPLLLQRESRQDEVKEHILKKRFEFSRISGERYATSMATHAGAFNSGSMEAQFMSLWSALESILPKPRGTHINHFVRYLSASCTNYYSFYRFDILDCDLSRAYARRYYDILGTDVRMERITRLIEVSLLPENEALLRDIKELCRERNPLGMHRIEKICSDHSTIHSIRDMINAHRDKIIWQIHRIYRTRNGIAHSGESFKYITTLLPNLHEYYINLLSYLECSAVDGRAAGERGLDEIFDKMLTEYGLFTKRLEQIKKDKAIDAENMWLYMPRPPRLLR